MTTTVVNIRSGEPFDVYIGRATRHLKASIWRNPYRIGRDGDRAAVVALYGRYITAPEQAYLLAQIGELRGKRLGCWCHPQWCHGHLLAAIADGRLEQAVTS